MNLRVGLIESCRAVSVSLAGRYVDASGTRVREGVHEFTRPVVLTPLDPPNDTFVLRDVTIGIGFHWERKEEQAFRGQLILEADPKGGLRVLNLIPIEDYVESVIASEMSGTSPLEFLKAHAVISRSWVASQIGRTDPGGSFRRETIGRDGEHEILAWYGRESHVGFDVCADDHCQRYQGVSRSARPNVGRAVRETRSEFLTWQGAICDARFYKCCGGVTERFAAAWEDRQVPYLTVVHDGDGPIPRVDEAWIRSRPPAWCHTDDREVLEAILPGFDQETTDFFRWRVDSSPQELGDLVAARTGVKLGRVTGLEALERGGSGRIVRLRIRGERGSLIVGKELEIRRVLSTSHLYSSAFVADVSAGSIVLEGAGWGHGVGLCQIGAGVQAHGGRTYRQILAHYYPGAELGKR